MHWPSLKASAIFFQKYLISLTFFPLWIVQASSGHIMQNCWKVYIFLCVHIQKLVCELFWRTSSTPTFCSGKGLSPNKRNHVWHDQFQTSNWTWHPQHSKHMAPFMQPSHLVFVSLICYEELKFLYTNHWLAYKTYHWLSLVVQCKYKGALGVLG